MIDWPIEAWIEIAKTLVVPVTILLLALILKPFLKTLFSRLTALETSGIEIDFKELSREAGLETSADETLATVATKRISESLKEASKEKLEKLRLALETEQVNQVIKYHQNSLAQSTMSFWFSIGAGTLGFFVIVFGSALALIGFQQSSAILTIVSGAIIDAVAALFFTQSNQARRLMTEFFDKLRKDRQFNESLRLCESIRDEQIQSQLKARLALFFAGIPADAVSTLENPSVKMGYSNAHRKEKVSEQIEGSGQQLSK